jgi:DNA-binding PadR family transcriptional regulator
MHGYEMFQQFRNSTLGEIVHLEMSQMYAFLKKLERLKYIEAELELQGSRPPRKVFHLTAVGQKILFQWLSEPVVRPREIRILFLIKLYFVQQFIPREMASLVKKQIVACRNFLDHLESKHSQHARHLSVLTLPAPQAGLPTLPRGLPVPQTGSPLELRQDERRGAGDDAFFEHVVLRGRIYQTRSLLDWLQELQHELAEIE